VNPGDELTLIRLYAHVLNVINSFVPDKIPETFKFKHKGKSFEIESKPAARMLTGMAFTAGEAIEVLEYMKRAQEALKKNPSQEGNIDFTLGLTEIAILVRQKGERLPAERPRLEKFIVLRRELFKSLSLDVVLSIRFFFSQYITELRNNPNFAPFWHDVFSHLRGRGKTEAEREQYQKTIEAGEIKFIYGGWRTYYNVGVNGRWYEGKETTPFESVFYSDFEDLVSRISIQNVML
jgi:hypothetical protein